MPDETTLTPGTKVRAWRNEHYNHTQYSSQNDYSTASKTMKQIREQMEAGKLNPEQAAIEIHCRIGHSMTMARRAAYRIRWEIENAKSRT